VKNEDTLREAQSPLRCLTVESAPRLPVSGNKFIVVPLPCCSLLALPYWAKVIGEVRNTGSEEVLVKVVVRLLDADSTVLQEGYDTLVLDPGERGRFDIKLSEFTRDAAAYSISVEETSYEQLR